MRSFVNVAGLLAYLVFGSANPDAISAPAAMVSHSSGSGGSGIQRNPNMPPHESTLEDRLGSFFADCKRRIKRVWQRGQQDSLANKIVSCTFEVRRDGEIQNLRIVRSSGFEAADITALGFIRKAAPFHRPPDLLGSQSLLVEFSDYPNVDVKLVPEVKER